MWKAPTFIPIFKRFFHQSNNSRRIYFIFSGLISGNNILPFRLSYS